MALTKVANVTNGFADVTVGKEKIVRGSNLKSKQVTSCGCYHKEIMQITKRLIDLTGKKFGKLIVLSYQYKKHNQTYWKCKCECGR